MVQHSYIAGWGRQLGLRLAFLVVVMLLAVGAAFSQDGLLKRANLAYEQMSYPEAIKGYEKVLAKKFDKTAMLRLADCYRLTNNTRKAAEVYSKVVNLNQIDPINYFYFAQSLMNNGMYPEAAKWFDRYTKAMPGDPRGAQFAESCRNIGRFFADSAEVVISPFPHNTKVDEFSPVWYKGGILFSSSRGEGDIVESKYDWNGQPFLDLYYSKMGGEGEQFARPILVKGKLNTRFHEATCAWDSVHKQAYFTRNNFFEGKKVADENGILNLKLFYADVPDAGPWTNVRSLPFNSDAYSVGHPAVLWGGNEIIFISDKPGGLGGTDLYRSRREGDAWSAPENLGPGINSPGNEMFPYITPDGTLYFSSDGLGGLGGLDVFRVSLAAQEPKPQNLGAPINGPADDFGYLINAEGGWGMLSSNRGGGRGSDDLYLFRYKKPTWNCVVLDAETRQPIENAAITLQLPAVQRELFGKTGPQGNWQSLLQRDVTYQVMIEASQYRALRTELGTYGAKAGETIQDTFLLERPGLLVTTRVLDPATGYPIPYAKVRVVGSDISLVTDSAGLVSFYVDPYPSYVAQSSDCPPMAVPDYCFLFTDEGFAPSDTLKLTYEWKFGDGARAKGLEVQHCYAAPGTYEVELNLLDAKGKVFMNQTTYTLEVRPPAGLRFDGPDTVTVGMPVRYQAHAEDIDGCTFVAYDWAWGDSLIQAGSQVERAFSKAGRYSLQLTAYGNSLAAPRTCSACITREIVAMPAGWRRTYRAQRDSLRAAWTAKELPPPPANVPCTPQEPENYCFSLTDEGEPDADTLSYIYLWDLGDGHQMEGLTIHYCYEQPGVYPVRLAVLDGMSRKQISVVTEYDLEVQDLRQVYVESYDTIEMGKAAQFDAYKSDAGGCRVQAVHWDFGDGTSATGPDVQHTYARRGSYRVQMVLQGTDAQGAACTRCSFKQVNVLPGYRGNALRDSIRQAHEVAQPIPLVPEGAIVLEIDKPGYEKQQVMIDPGKPEGTLNDTVRLRPQVADATVRVAVVDQATGLRLQGVTLQLQDARTGLYLDEYPMTDSLVDLPLDPGQSYYVIARKPGYLAQVEPIGPIEKGKSARLKLQLPLAEVGKSWVLHNLYYDFDQSYIRHDAAIELAKLTVFLQANPQLTVELSSHTDVRGSDEYNLSLSQARAESAVAFLRARGIAAERIIPRGYGEQRLANACQDGVACSEAQHQANRRTEITVLGLKDPIYSMARPVEEIWSTESIQIPSSPLGQGPFTILLSTTISPRPGTDFQRLAGTQFAVTAREIDGFWLYAYGDYPTYHAAAANLEAVRAKGFLEASILAVPAFTLPASSRTGTPITQTGSAALTSLPPLEDGYYAVQVAVLGRSVQQSFLDSFGEYRSALFEQKIDGRRVFFVGKFGSESEAMKHLVKIRRSGHGDAFLVRFEQGKKVNLDKIGGQ